MKNKFPPIAAWAALVALAVPLHAQTKVYATGLLNPAKIILGPSGSLLVSEFDVTPNSGRISIVTSGGVRQTLVDGLPSGVGENGPDGPTGIVLDGNTLYVAIGEGDQLQNGTAAGTQVPNQKAPASPVLDTILQINFGGPVDKVAAGFSLKAADHAVLANGQPVSLDNGSGDKATISTLSQFRYRSDAVTIYRNSHPYALVKTPEDPNHLYLSDAGLNAIVQVDLPSGRSRVITTFPNQPNRVAGSGPPTVEAVPDSIEPVGGKLYVTLLTGFPFSAGDSKIMSVDPDTGAASVLVDNLTSAIAVTTRSRFFGGIDLYVLQFSTDLLNNGPGQLLIVSGGGAPKVVADKLPGPSGMVQDRSAGKLYIVCKNGSILEYDLPN